MSRYHARFSFAFFSPPLLLSQIVKVGSKSVHWMPSKVDPIGYSVLFVASRHRRGHVLGHVNEVHVPVVENGLSAGRLGRGVRGKLPLLFDGQRVRGKHLGRVGRKVVQLPHVERDELDGRRATLGNAVVDDKVSLEAVVPDDVVAAVQVGVELCKLAADVGGKERLVRVPLPPDVIQGPVGRNIERVVLE
jgi:hypothetical protein